MPDRTYVAKSYPPKLSDRMLSHYAEILIALLGVVLGVTHIAVPEAELSIKGLPTMMSLALAVLMVAGGILWGYVIGKRFRTINSYWFWLRCGLSMSGFSWFAYFIASIGLRPYAVTVWATYLIVSMVPIGLWLISLAQEKAIRARRS